LIHRLKYGGATFVASALSELAQEADLAPFAECSHIVPVPLHRQRLQSRGLNQAVTLARLLFPDRLAAIRVDGLIRVRKTLAQTELRGADRRRNLRNAFRINEAFDPSGSSICLVDDVFT
jgi:predicted amidophosphoribosyltransferase